MEQGSEFTGDLSDVHQEEEYVPLPLAPVKVQQDGPIQTHSVPSVSGGSRSFAFTEGDQPKRVGNLDPRRRSLMVICSAEFYIGENANEVASRYAAWWPANVPCRITHQEEVYVMPDADATLSVISENWAS